MRTPQLFLQACMKFFLGLALTGLLLFVPAGTLRFWNGWLLLGILFLPMFAAGLVLWVKAPGLLEKRLKAKETEAQQKAVIALSGLMFAAGFVTAGLDFRFSWTHIPLWLIAVAVVLFLLAYILYGEVLRENAYLSRTIEVQAQQTVVDTGLYAIVRHPMYAATVLLFLTIPVILGSTVSFVIFLIYPLLIVRRIQNEEAVLKKGLPGYSAYQQKVKYRLIPFLW